MPGMIRFMLGLVLTFAAVGGIDDPAAPLLPLVFAAAVGLLLMLWAVRAIQQTRDRPGNQDWGRQR